jgi:Ca2+-binding RTX toxin-like protein
MLAALVAFGLSQVATAQSDVIPLVDLNSQLPAIQVGDVTVLGPSEATAQATIDTNGLATEVYVEYGANNVLNLKSPKVSIAAGADLANVVVQLLGLEPGSAISYRIVAENSAGKTATPTATITTPPAAPSSGSTESSTIVDLASGRSVSSSSAFGRKTARCTIVGTPGPDRLRGTSKRDVICGLGGNDRIQGRSGADVIVGGPGNDSINGNRGRDRLFGNGGDDRLVSRDRNIGEPLDGGPGRDQASVDRGDRLTSVERPVRHRVRRH